MSQKSDGLAAVGMGLTQPALAGHEEISIQVFFKHAFQLDRQPLKRLVEVHHQLGQPIVARKSEPAPEANSLTDVLVEDALRRLFQIAMALDVIAGKIMGNP